MMTADSTHTGVSHVFNLVLTVGENRITLLLSGGETKFILGVKS